jgi:hypothetical protein
MEERRRYKRQILVMYLHVFDRKSGKVIGYLGDLSAHGLMLVSEHALPSHLEMSLGIRLHKWDSDMHYVNAEEHAHIPCEGETRWSRSLEDGLYATGFMFTTVTAEAQKAIDALIERIGQADELNLDAHLYLDAMLLVGGHAKDCAASSLVKQTGVMSVSFDDATPHLLIVQYHRERTSPDAILQHIQNEGFSGHLVTIRN